MTRRCDVLVVGAGPTGLTLALQAHDHGAAVRVIDRRDGSPRPSRALVMQPRTLEVLRPLGVTDELLAAGDARAEARLHLGRRTVSAELWGFDLPDTPFPHLLLIRQAEVERVLTDALERRGVRIEWGAELQDVETESGAAVATVSVGSESRRVGSRFVVGCDGRDSVVRRRLGVAWTGGRHRDRVVLADVELTGPVEPGVLHVAPLPSGVIFLFPAGEHASWRVLTTGRAGDRPGDDELRRLLRQALPGVELAEVAWSRVVSLEHRIASSFRRGPVFLAGDAAHAHSPAAAQGMNAGVQDAANLGWKLALAAHRPPGSPELDSLLDSYETERRPVIERIVWSTRLVFWAEASTAPLARAVRAGVRWVGPVALPFVLRRRRTVATGVRVLGQLVGRYRRGPWAASGTRRARPRPGSRLGDGWALVDGAVRRRHDLLAHPGPTALLERDAPALDPAGELGSLTIARLEDRPGLGVVVVRPDGHVGFVGRAEDARIWMTGWATAAVGGPGP